MTVIVNGIVVKKINVVKNGVTTALKAGYCGSTKVFSAGGIPEFTYSGKYSIAENNVDNWKIKFLTSGTLKITSLNGAESGIDVFLVGGGGGGMWSKENEKWGGGGGGGGYTKTSRKVSVKENTSYPIVIGAGGAETKDGGASSAFGFSASGGKSCHSNMFRVGGAGGSGGGEGGDDSGAFSDAGGAGGSNGSDGEHQSSGHRGAGQGTTTREFGESSGTLYAGGGGGGAGNRYGVYGAGGAGGGGRGGSVLGAGYSATANTGGGGGGGGSSKQQEGKGQHAGSGGSGIVVIRNAR